MFSEFMRSNRGNVVVYIIVLAFIIFGGYQFFIHLKLISASNVEDKTVPAINYVTGQTDEPPPSTSTSGYDAITDESQQYNGVMAPPKIDISPESTEYFYSVNDAVDVKALPIETGSYKPKEPLFCKWEGIKGYTGTSCTPNAKAKLDVGNNYIKVKMCDARKACAEEERKIFLGYRDPFLVMHEEWDNYVLSGASGDWKYDSTNKIIYSTKNVDWSGYWNTKDANLTNYEVSFKMRVSSPDTDDDSIGFTFRMKDSKNFYFFTLDNRDSNGGTSYHSGLYKSVDGVKTRLVNLMPAKWIRNQWNDVNIRAEDSHIQVWLDGKLVADVIDTSNPKGGYGPFSLSQAYAQYKDLKIIFN
ncbi:hypothetical protein CN918_32230 [Priestia megaterium]|nr:hypothetical protein CN918_32230 [Priestia megaterium]